MFSIRKINPAIRAVGTMGAVAALVGGITYAAVGDNTVTLANNELTSVTQTLAIGAGADCSDGSNQSTPGFDTVALTPNQASDPVSFCLANFGGTPMDITTELASAIPDGGLDPSHVMLNFSCKDHANSSTTTVTLSKTLSDLTGSPVAFGEGALAAPGQWDCTVTATADSSAGSGTTGKFDINFVGTDVTS